MHVDSSTTATIAERELVRRVEAHTGRKIGVWEVTYSLYVHQGGDKRVGMETVVSSEKRGVRVLMMGSRVVEAEDGFIGQLQKLADYRTKSTRSIRGVAYDFVDFVVRVGLAFDRNNNASGVVVEIEYAPCVIVDDCSQLIAELMERIASQLVPPPQAGHESLATKAASTTFRYTAVHVDFKRYIASEKPFFGLRHSMLLYRQLLADADGDSRKELPHGSTGR